jgi:hypothetical protein
VEQINHLKLRPRTTEHVTYFPCAMSAFRASCLGSRTLYLAWPMYVEICSRLSGYRDNRMKQNVYSNVQQQCILREECKLIYLSPYLGQRCPFSPHMSWCVLKSIASCHSYIKFSFRTYVMKLGKWFCKNRNAHISGLLLFVILRVY